MIGIWSERVKVTDMVLSLTTPLSETTIISDAGGRILDPRFTIRHQSLIGVMTL